MKKRIIMSRKIKIKDADRSFDIEFWQKVGAEGRFSAAWDMIKEFYLIRGFQSRNKSEEQNAYQQRLQRSIQNIKQK